MLRDFAFAAWNAMPAQGQIGHVPICSDSCSARFPRKHYDLAIVLGQSAPSRGLRRPLALLWRLTREPRRQEGSTGLGMSLPVGTHMSIPKA